jgi:hypothetical protein
MRASEPGNTYIIPGGEARRAAEHDPGKWKPVFGKDHAPMKNRHMTAARRPV